MMSAWSLEMTHRAGKMLAVRSWEENLFMAKWFPSEYMHRVCLLKAMQLLVVKSVCKHSLDSWSFQWLYRLKFENEEKSKRKFPASSQWKY